MDIFISYSRSDRDRVNYIATALQAEGYQVWWDRDIRAGEEFDDVIDKAIKKSSAIIVVWSEQSINSRWVKEEAEDGIDAEILIPVTIDPVIMPRGFRRIQAAALQDGGDNPTTSKNWREFLDSVRKIAGPPEGPLEGSAPKTQAELLQDITNSAAGQAAAAKAATDTDTGSGVPVWKRYWPIGAGVVGVLLAGLLTLQLFGGGPSAPPPPDDMTPVVLGIYPNEGFGIDQADGLRAAFSDTPSVMIRDLAASLDSMKGRNAPELIEGLRTNLAQRNVIAIVGPSITEFTPEVLRVVEESGRRPAIILTTASSRRNIGWDESDLPIFRVGSGMDERADQFSRLAQNTVASGVELIMLYESVPNSDDLTYGELFFQSITERLPQWQEWSNQNRVRSISYVRGRIMDKASLPRIRSIFDQNKMIIVVGLSSDYRELVENLYSSENQPRAALLGGWNSSKAVQQLSREIGIQNTRLFDMTDVHRSPADTRGLPDSLRFQETFGFLTPALRQEAVAYDSGLVIKQAVSQIEGEVTAEKLVELLLDQSFDGITGEISFGVDDPSRGQNRGQAGGMRPLYNLSYDPSTSSWREIESFDELLVREPANN